MSEICTSFVHEGLQNGELIALPRADFFYGVYVVSDGFDFAYDERVIGLRCFSFVKSRIVEFYVRPCITYMSYLENNDSISSSIDSRSTF